MPAKGRERLAPPPSRILPRAGGPLSKRAPMNIQDQIVLVTGAGRGLGAAVATAFVREGARVVVNYRRSEEAAGELSRTLGERALAVQADVSDRGQVDAMFAA